MEVSYHWPEVRMGQDVAVVCDGERIAMDPQLEAQNKI